MYRLLLADDSYDQREVIKYFLSQHEKEWLIEEAKNGREAWQLFQKQPFDLIITDVKMPFMDGHALVARIKEAVPEIPVMFISGFEDFHYVKKAIQLQAVDYLLKPIDPDDFYEQINKIILFIDQQKQRAYTKTIAQTHYLKEILSKPDMLKQEKNLISIPQNSSGKFFLSACSCRMARRQKPDIPQRQMCWKSWHRITRWYRKSWNTVSSPS